MKSKLVRQVFQPVWGMERRETVTRFMYAIIFSVIIIDVIMIALRLWGARTLMGPVIWSLLILLFMQFILLYMLRRGYVDQAAFLLIASSWMIVTYLNWNADGIHDVAIYLYFVILLMAALLTNWWVTITLAVLSIAAIWIFAVAEDQGLKTPHLDAPLNIARDLTAIFSLLVILIYLVVSSVSRSLDAVREGEKKFRKVFQVSPVAISITTLNDGILVDANEAFFKLTGYHRDTAIGKSITQLGFAGSEGEFSGFTRRLLAEKSLQNPDFQFVSFDGQVRIALAFHELIELENRPGILTMLYDMTEQRSAQMALRYSERRMRALLNAIPDMIFEFSRDGTILQFIPSTVNVPLLPPEQFMGKTIMEVLPVLADQTMFAVGRALESGDVNAFTYELFQDGQNRTFEARFTPVGPDTVLAMVRDVSLQKWIEEERENLIVELEQKNAELERFTYTVSHDLKSPLITIRGFLGFLREDSQKGNLARLDADIQRISAATEKMQALLNDLLELSRVGQTINPFEDVDLDILVKETLELLHGRISQTGVSVSVAQALPHVRGDYERLTEVMQNLIDNACKFMGDQDAPRIEIGHQGLRGDMPVCFVRDNGMGIPAQFHEKIFGLFNKLDVHSEGTGVGLALVKRIIEFHGGRIWVESEPGRGTTFFFSLPAAGIKSG